MSALRRGWTVCLLAHGGSMRAHDEGRLRGNGSRAVDGRLVTGPVVGDIAVKLVVVVLQGRRRVVGSVVVGRCDGGRHVCWLLCENASADGQVYIVCASSITLEGNGRTPFADTQ